MPRRRPNIVLLGVDSLRRDHMSPYGYRRMTAPHIARLAEEGTLFEQHFSPNIPTTPAYAAMLTGLDCFGTGVVALRHRGDLAPGAHTLAEVLGEAGYATTCVGFSGNPSARGFQRYLDFEGWAPDATGRCPKAENLNRVTLPELDRLAADGRPFFLFLRHMDPHAPYLPPQPFQSMFHGGDPTQAADPLGRSMEPVFAFKPFADFLSSWMPEGCADPSYVEAQYDGAIAYMDACIRAIFAKIDALGISEQTIVVLTADHGETLYEHDCFFDHHGLYEPTLVVPLIVRFPSTVPAGRRVSDISVISDVMPTLLDLAGVRTRLRLQGRSLVPSMRGPGRSAVSELYLTEATWMRKHGWRTPEWKLIHALEPDFHFKPEVELYNLTRDPGELRNVAQDEPEVVAFLEARMQAHIARRQRETGRTNPMMTNLGWHGSGDQPFTSSQQAYDSLHIGSMRIAKALQAGGRRRRKEGG